MFENIRKFGQDSLSLRELDPRFGSVRAFPNEPDLNVSVSSKGVVTVGVYRRIESLLVVVGTVRWWTEGTLPEDLREKHGEFRSEVGAHQEEDDSADDRVEHGDALDDEEENDHTRELVELATLEIDGEVVGVVRRPAHEERYDNRDEHRDGLLLADERDLAMAVGLVARRCPLDPELQGDLEVDGAHDEERQNKLGHGDEPHVHLRHRVVVPELEAGKLVFLRVTVVGLSDADLDRRREGHQNRHDPDGRDDHAQSRLFHPRTERLEDTDVSTGGKETKSTMITQLDRKLMLLVIILMKTLFNIVEIQCLKLEEL